MSVLAVVVATLVWVALCLMFGYMAWIFFEDGAFVAGAAGALLAVALIISGPALLYASQADEPAHPSANVLCECPAEDPEG